MVQSIRRYGYHSAGSQSKFRFGLRATRYSNMGSLLAASESHSRYNVEPNRNAAMASGGGYFVKSYEFIDSLGGIARSKIGSPLGSL